MLAVRCLKVCEKDSTFWLGWSRKFYQIYVGCSWPSEIILYHVVNLLSKC